MEIIELSKPKNGIERQGKKIGALKEKYQIFIVNVFNAWEMQTNFYDFKKSKSLQNELSTYIHSYYFFETDMRADSLELKEVPELINSTEKFLRESSYVEGEGHGIRSLDLRSMPLEDKALLDKWKIDVKMTEKELLENLIENKLKRRENK